MNVNDSAYRYLIQQLAYTPGFKIWFAEESCGDYLPELVPHREQLLLLTHRVDIYNKACALNIPAHINDATWPTHNHPTTPIINACFIRIAKEKPWVHHLINQARQYLPTGSSLYLAGHKQEGIKTYADKAAKLFNSPQKAQKMGEFYSIHLEQTSTALSELTALSEATALGELTALSDLKVLSESTALSDLKVLNELKALNELLPTDNYPHLRPTLTLHEKTILSKPGIYGWDKIDQGSQLLVEAVLAQNLTAVQHCLDLGCGYGYLTLATAHLPFAQRTCTDNNSAALAACQLNCDNWSINANLILADCAEGITTRFDLILCNPPFHQGFSVENQLTTRFLAAAAQRLQPNGAAFFVVNQFIPLERKACDYFKHCEKILSNGSFKVLRLTK
ncbi:MAG: hypothetical protein RL497_2877 [Pseudomonadota bacterium]|jgi:16S rRNA (guanine1207-N2)-methyltransferase